VQEYQTTIRRILAETKLNKFDTRVLLCHILNFSKADLILKLDYELSATEYELYLELYKDALKGVPINYLIGFKEFYSRQFKVNRHTLIPRPETELLVDNLIKLAKPNAKVLELGTGSGCIAISCKLERPDLQITATDYYINTLNIAKENAKLHNAEISFIQSDWYSNITGRFDLIVSNPPYIEVSDEHLHDLKYEPQHALTDFADGLSCIRQILTGAKKHLEQSGHILLEHGYNQGLAVRELLIEAGFFEVNTLKDYANLDRITIGKI